MPLSFNENIKINPLADPVFYVVLAIFSGELTLKSFGIPIDINSSVSYVFLLLTLFIATINRRKVVTVHSYSLPVYLLFAYILIRNISVDSYSLENYWLPVFATLIMLVVVESECISRNDCERLIKYTFWVVAILVVLGVVKMAISQGRLSVLGGPNGYYKIVLLFEVISFYRYLTNKTKFLLFWIILSVFLVIMTGSKGGIITVIVLIPIEYVYYLFTNNKSLGEGILKLLKLALSAVIIFLVIYYIINNNEFIRVNYNRAIGMFSSPYSQLTSVTDRQYLFELAWEDFIDNPLFGHGALSIFHETLGSSIHQAYVHNIILELLGEQGLIGFCFLMIVVIRVYIKCRPRYMSDPLIFSLLCAFTVYFIGAQFSGNILDDKVLFLFYLLIEKLSYEEKKKVAY